MSQKLIRTYCVREDIFDKILYDYSSRIEYTDNIWQYAYGYSNKNTIYYNEEYLICREYIVDYYCHNIEDITSWKQCRLRKTTNTDKIIDNDITGTYAWNYIMKLLLKHYTENEIDSILHAHEAEYDEAKKQYHYNYNIDVGALLKIPNCKKYDINGAHCDALLELFPKASTDILYLHKRRKKDPNIKKFFNYFVGELCRKGYRLTYNWIVQRTNALLMQAIELTDGELIYANTDGFIVFEAKHNINTSTNLGEFKAEYEGDVYVYRSKNYILYQCGDELKGSCRQQVRDKIDLRIGKVAEYDQRRELLGYDNQGKAKYITHVENVNYKIVEQETI